MEINSLLLYGLCVMHNFDNLCGVVFTLGVIATLGTSLGIVLSSNSSEEMHEKAQALDKKTFKTTWFKVLAIVLLLDAIFVPSYKEIIGIYIIPKVANAELTQKIPDAVSVFLDKFIEEYAPKKK